MGIAEYCDNCKSYKHFSAIDDCWICNCVKTASHNKDVETELPTDSELLSRKEESVKSEDSISEQILAELKFINNNLQLLVKRSIK